jgi:YVTN family beta-propeller protein
MSHRQGLTLIATVLAVVVLVNGVAAASPVTATIPVGTNPTAIAINPAGTFAYVLNVNSPSVSKIDLATNTVDATISGVGGTAIAINPLGTYAYVVNRNRLVTKIDLATNAATTPITFGLGSVATGIAISPSGNYAYVLIADAYVSSDPGSVKKIDLSTNSVVGTISVSPSPGHIAISSDGAALVVTGGDIPHGGTGKIDIINLTSDTVTTTLTVNDNSPLGATVSPDNRFAYVTGNNSIYKVNLTVGSVEKTIPCSCNPITLAIRPAGDFAFVGTGTGLAKLDLGTDKIVASDFPVANAQVDAITINSSGTYGYTANRMLNTVSKVDLLAKLDQSITLTPHSGLPQTGESESVIPTAASGLAVSLASDTTSVCTVIGTTVTYVGAGSCTLRADQAGDSSTWNAATTVRDTYTVYLAPPSGEVGVTINDTNPYTNVKDVILSIVWPAHATQVRISNDGGFRASTTVTRGLSKKRKWELDDSVAGMYTKIVYIRFDGAGIDTTKTYSDDIILDNTRPVIVNATLSTTTGAGIALKYAGYSLARASRAKVYKINTKATDDKSGVVQIQVSAKKSGANPLTTAFKKVIKIRSPKATLWLRVIDRAGNASPWRRVVAPAR